MIRFADVIQSLQPHVSRTPQTTAEELADAFVEIGQLNGAGVYVSTFAGTSEWERHPSGDELVQVLEGSTLITILVGESRQEFALTEGAMTIVPEGCWHRFTTESDVVAILTVTPPPTEHHRDGDPL